MRISRSNQLNHIPVRPVHAENRARLAGQIGAAPFANANQLFGTGSTGNVLWSASAIRTIVRLGNEPRRKSISTLELTLRCVEIPAASLGNEDVPGIDSIETAQPTPPVHLAGRRRATKDPRS